MKVWRLGSDKKVQLEINDLKEVLPRYFDPFFNGQPVSKWSNVVATTKQVTLHILVHPIQCSVKKLFSLYNRDD